MTTDERDALLRCAMYHLSMSVPYHIESIDTTANGLRIRSGYEDSCRQCHMGRISASFEVTYDELANEEWDGQREMKARWEAAHKADKKVNRNWPYA